MDNIVTLTLNPSVDVSWEVEDMVPTIKMRSSSGTGYPGGGGINVSRVIKILGGQSIAICTAGWLSGEMFRLLLEERGLVTRIVPIAGATRVSAVIYERSSGQQYRVTPPGPDLQEKDWRACLDAVSELTADYLVATGSLPKGTPNDFYARVIRMARERGSKVVLDTSGRPLFEALKEGCFLVKPNLRELETLFSVKAPRRADQEALCRRIIDEGRAENVALTLGPDGALLATKDDILHLKSPEVTVRTTVGAGDSFVGGFVYGLASGESLVDSFVLALAAGTAAVMTSGTELCRREDVEQLRQEFADQIQ